MKLGHKQQRIFELIKLKGYVTLKDFEEIYNLSSKRAIKKINEFTAMGWIKKIKGTEMPIKYEKCLQKKI